METLSKNLMILRKKRGLSREAVARALEISSMTYQRYEKDLRDPTAPLVGLGGDADCFRYCIAGKPAFLSQDHQIFRQCFHGAPFLHFMIS